MFFIRQAGGPLAGSEKTITARGGQCDVIPFDVRHAEEAENVRRLIGHVDVLINNA